MASVENVPPVNNDSEMEEGEIVDDLDELSDISSEEEFLLRQRLLVLENYNNVLERKKAKRASILSGKNVKKTEILLHDLSEISTTELEDTQEYYKYTKDQTYPKSSSRQKKISLHNCYGKFREHKKKNHHKRRLEVKVISESSDESDDEYRNKRRKLANAVALNKDKADTSLRARLEKMLCESKNEECLTVENVEVIKRIENVKDTNNIDDNMEHINGVDNIEENALVCIEENNIEVKDVDASNTQITYQESNDADQFENNEEKTHNSCGVIDLCSDDSMEIKDPNGNVKTNDIVDSDNAQNMKENTSNKLNSDDELEVLRQHALKTKSLKTKSHSPKPSTTIPNKPQSEEDDSDTADLRIICLKSALLKKAFEMKLKQKLRKRLKSKSISLQDDLMIYQEELGNVTDLENNTDIESVDMDIGSDGDERVKESNGNCSAGSQEKPLPNNVNNHYLDVNVDDELEEDEDLLRAKLLTSLSKNLPNLIDMDIVNTIDSAKSTDSLLDKAQVKNNVEEEKKFIINLGDSDSEGEHEATKNLTKMHMKLSEQVVFQQKLDLFLKSTRMKVENTKLPDVVQQPLVPKPHAKYVPKAVNHLPKSEQIEYKNLVKRMAELEKIKQARQTSMNSQNNSIVPKETLKPRNISVDTTKMVTNNIEERIAASRKNIAEESAKMLKLKEEATKLLQKYKIVATELRNISTAVTLNKKEQRIVQNKLTSIRVQHQMLLKSSNFKHSTGGLPSINQTNNKLNVSKLQKENNPSKDMTMLKAVTVSVVNNLRKENTGHSPKLSVQVDVNSHKKTVKLPSPEKERIVRLVGDEIDTNKIKEAITSEENINENIKSNCDKKDMSSIHPDSERNCADLHTDFPKNDTLIKHIRKDKHMSDYQSPLEAFGSTTWEEDPNAFLCPYEVGGSCRDPDCKYLHPKNASHQ